jgi:hypothetical protein
MLHNRDTLVAGHHRFVLTLSDPFDPPFPLNPLTSSSGCRPSDAAVARERAVSLWIQDVVNHQQQYL